MHHEQILLSEKIFYLCINFKHVIIMIHTVPNPKMTTQEVKSFRENFAKCVSKDFTPDKMSEIKKRVVRIKSNYNKIIQNSGGKNPILGH